MDSLNLCEKLVLVPLFKHIQLVRILFEIGELEWVVVGKGHDNPVRHSRRVYTQQVATWVDHAQSPCLSTVVSGPEGPDQGLALVFMDEIQCGLRGQRVQGAGVDQQVQDGGQDGYGGGIGRHLDTREKRVAENDGHAMVTDVPVLVGATQSAVLPEGLSTVWKRKHIADRTIPRNNIWETY